MDKHLIGAPLDRAELASGLTQIGRVNLMRVSWREIASMPIPARGGIVATWATDAGDPLAQVLVVRDEDYADTFSWMNSFFAGLSPITQWCRVVTQSDARAIAELDGTATLGRSLGAWVGMILAECSVQAGGVQSLKDLSGSAAISTSSFAAGRTAAIWKRASSFSELASKHDVLSMTFREGGRRPLSAQSLVPLWHTLSGGPVARAPELEPLTDLTGLFYEIVDRSEHLDPAELVDWTASRTRDVFDLEELTRCARGPQVERVRALDRLGERLASAPSSPISEALMGLAASFIEPGNTVSAELLRRHTSLLPAAPLWQGAFAGAMAPLKALTDHAGLGRVIAKALLDSSDLSGRPSCDIAFDEVARWISPRQANKLNIRSMSARILAVELLPGVTCSFSLPRNEQSASTPRFDNPRHQSAPRSSQSSVQDLHLAVADLRSRVERLESQQDAQTSLNLGQSTGSKARKTSRSTSKKTT